MFASLMRFHVAPVRTGLDAICALRKLRVGSLRNTSISRGFPTTAAAAAAVAAAIPM